MDSDEIRKESASRRDLIVQGDVDDLAELSIIHALYEIAAQLADMNQIIRQLDNRIGSLEGYNGRGNEES